MNKKHKKTIQKGRRKSKKPLHGLIIKIDDNISIMADKDQYIIRNGKQQTYFGSLEHCFGDIFDNMVRKNLIENTRKDMETMIKIHKDTSKWLKSIFRKIESPKYLHEK